MSDFPLAMAEAPPSLVVTTTVPGWATRLAQGLVIPVPASQTVRSANWRRKYRRCVHWLMRQELNHSNSVGVFLAPGLSPALTTAETNELLSVSNALAALGYLTPALNAGLPITPP